MDGSFLGSPWAVHTLQRTLATGRLHHAYLFTGPDGVGRRTLALRFVQALFCQNPPAVGQMCHQCRACRTLMATLDTEMSHHPDVLLVEAEKQKLELQVHQVREALHHLTLTPQVGPYRVAVFLDFDRATPAAANALLKTLEEPNPSALLLLTAEATETVLPTVASRCQMVPLRPMAVEDLAHLLTRREGVDLDRARQVAAWAGGRPGYALRLLRDPDTYHRHTAWLDEVPRIVVASRRERLEQAHFWVKETETRDLPSLLLVWAAFWRDVLHLSLGHSLPLFHPDRLDLLQRLAQTLTPDKAFRAWNETVLTLGRLRWHVSPQLLLESLFLSWPSVPAYVLHG